MVTTLNRPPGSYPVQLTTRDLLTQVATYAAISAFNESPPSTVGALDDVKRELRRRHARDTSFDVEAAIRRAEQAG